VTNIRFHPDAERELQDATIWYDHQRKGLGAEMFLCVDESIARILDNPLQYPMIHKNIRRTVVRRFPFAIFFEVDENEIRIIAIFHSRRNPDRWKSRQ
jgi:toxin ParE1/3/4